MTFKTHLYNSLYFVCVLWCLRFSWLVKLIVPLSIPNSILSRTTLLLGRHLVQRFTSNWSLHRLSIFHSFHIVAQTCGYCYWIIYVNASISNRVVDWEETLHTAEISAGCLFLYCKNFILEKPGLCWSVSIIYSKYKIPFLFFILVLTDLPGASTEPSTVETTNGKQMHTLTLNSKRKLLDNHVLAFITTQIIDDLVLSFLSWRFS